MRTLALLAGFTMFAGTARTADLANLPPNTWVPLKPVSEQANNNPDEKGQWNCVWWNKLVYDPEGKRVLFNDRWVDKKHGGYTIYGNCIFSFDPATAKLTPLKINNWCKEPTAGGGYLTKTLAENEKEPSPCDRHVYQAFDYAPDLKSLFICNGANQGASRDGQIVGHKATNDTWRFDLEKKLWTKIESKQHPPNQLEDGMAYCPDTKSIVYAGHGKIWIMDTGTGQWRVAKNDLPRSHMGMSVILDAPRKRMLLAGGGTYGAWKTKTGGFNCLYAFDPKTETVSKLADSPTALNEAALAYDSRRDLFVTTVVYGKDEQAEQPSGMFCYDPKKDAWHEIKSTNEIPDPAVHWMRLCYDSTNDCLIGLSKGMFFAFRYVP
ncbi:MAG: hypothetical protein HY291_19200 [Planctomycetes bacterium]|nr:hypothetical protein [Planctomycetota bacterium]